jgi:hypothetical protein
MLDAEVVIARPVMEDTHVDVAVSEENDLHSLSPISSSAVFVAQYKMTVLILPSGATVRLTQGFEPPYVKSMFSLEDLIEDGSSCEGSQLNMSLKSILKSDVRETKLANILPPHTRLPLIY